MNKFFLVSKYLGGILLITSYIAQDFLYDNLNTEYQEYVEVGRKYSELNNSALSYLNLYFTFNLEDKETEFAIAAQYINMAAKNLAMARITQIMSRDIPDEEKKRLTQALLGEASMVSDYGTYVMYIQRANELDQYDLQEAVDRKNEILELKEFYRWLFLSTYVLGSFLLLVGLELANDMKQD